MVLAVLALGSSAAFSRLQAAPIVSNLSAPAGSPVHVSKEGPTVQLETKSGYKYGWVSEVLAPTEKKHGAVKFKLGLPPGKKLEDLSTVLFTIPPGGSAPLVAPKTCVALGIGLVSLSGVSGGRDWVLLASQGIAVVEHLLKKNPNLNFVFAGFSMGGFSAQHLGSRYLDRCRGLLLLGNYYLQPPLPKDRPVIMLVGELDMVLGYAEKSLKEQSDIGANIRLMTMPGGHGYGRAEDQGKALKAILATK